MAISRIGAASAASTSLTMPSHQTGDLLISFAYRDGSVVPPTVPSGWLTLNAPGASTNSAAVGMKYAASGSETSGTWTNATQLIILCYRSVNLIYVTGATNAGASTTTINYPAVGTVGSLLGRYIGLAGYRTNNTDMQVAPTGMTNIVSVAGASTGEITAHDTGDTLQSGWSSTDYTITTGSTSAYRSFVYALVDSGIAVRSPTARYLIGV